MTTKERNIGLAFLTFYLYFAVTISLSLLGVKPEGGFADALNTTALIVVLVLMAVLFGLMIRRLASSSYSGSAKFLWFTIFLFTNIFGATVFYIFDMSRSRN